MGDAERHEEEDGGRLGALRRASPSLADFVAGDAEASALVARDGPLPDAGDYIRRSLVAAQAGWPELRLFKRRELAAVAARDAAGEIDVGHATAALADLADACLGAGLALLEAQSRLGVVGMGKLGGRELNYYSDIDVMLVAAGDTHAVARIATRLLQELGAPSPQGQAYVIDANLRPEGRSGPLVRSLDGYLEYYRRWAKPWEHQALIKARASAGATALAGELVAQTRAIVFPREVTTERVLEIRRIKERVEEHAIKTARRAGAREADDVKLGPGGIRDIEFSIQLLQLVHGGHDESVRQAGTLDALRALVEGGYVAEDDGAGLAVAYRWLRNVEHRLQIRNERRVHTLPADAEARDHLARALGFRGSPAASAAARFEESHRAVLADVRARFEKLFYRPMVETLGEAAPRLPAPALAERLGVLGFRDVERAARTLSDLVAGSSRRAKLFRVMTPALLRWLASTPSPDAGLFSFLRLGEALEGRLDVLGALRDNPAGIRFLAQVLGSGRLLGDLLIQVPDEIALIADPRGPGPPKERDRLLHEAASSLEWRTPERRMDGVRRFKRREMLRIALTDIGGDSGWDETGRALADLADACLQAGLTDVDFPFAVIGMGKLGGRELTYSSDIDVMFVHDGDPARAEKVAEELLRAIGEVTREGQAFRVDAALRPEGRAGPLARSLDAFTDYYDKWGRPWEHLALIKARLAAGDADLGDTLVAATRRWAYPEAADAAGDAEIRHLKARMERERIPRGTDARRNLKLGPGGMSDVEFAVQMLQRRHGHAHGELQAANTLEALAAAGATGVMAPSDAAELDRAYRWLGRLRNRLYFLTARPADALPVKPELLEAVGVSMGYTEQPRQELEEQFLKFTRRVRRIAEAIIFG